MKIGDTISQQNFIELYRIPENESLTFGRVAMDTSRKTPLGFVTINIVHRNQCYVLDNYYMLSNRLEMDTIWGIVVYSHPQHKNPR